MARNTIPTDSQRLKQIRITTVTGKKESENEVFLAGANGYLTVYVEREAATVGMYFSYFGDNEYISTKEGRYFKTVNGYDVYHVELGIDTNSRGIYFVKCELDTVYGKMYGDFSGAVGTLKFKEGKTYQLIIEDEKYPDPSWFKEGIIYHIFVDRFNKGGSVPKRDDAVYFENWDETPEYPKAPGDFLRNNTFFGGTIWGIIEKLDYIKSLGTTTVYLSPVFKAYSNHKYDTGDFLTVDEGFGGDIALKELIEQCKKRNMGVILDGVFNHVGDDSVYFNKHGKYPTLGAYQSKESRYYPWFSFSNYPDEYDSWWGIGNLPKVKKIPEYKDFICNEVIKKYSDMGVSGWRLDVVDELERDFLSQIVKSVKSDKKDSVVIGEVWEDASSKRAYGELKHYFEGERLDGVTNYPLRNGIISFLKSGNSTELKNVLITITDHYPLRHLNLLMNILGTHDTERILSVLGDDSFGYCSNECLATRRLSKEAREKAIKLLKDAFKLLITSPGVPCIYYGDEVGMEGYHDPFNRRTYPWGREDKELTELLKKLGKIRSEKKALKEGKFKLFDSDDSTLGYERYTESGESIVTFANYSERDVSFPIKHKYVNLLTKIEYDENITLEPSTVLIAEKIN